ncbi:hypothetical protein SYNPS1DRAFT_13964 [Syncephalis pseudoplumigaleata]|uniref:Transmembrane protein 135 N-terminal domain-containing protein n=1 Tax=Syncephalis pseudoplumigaleata TaxID=1712513 RepID=A0A4V1J1X7_9FUNG|nr:hypothetical protein SYNPS1DRAFT_13964 [Syncephalis pseudoplumigaleata]|eukprot:RKP26599.1 hypothetical protein SYNPS1DRAFT_13964 [Syncephalis pseudoplumigaleata]
MRPDLHHNFVLCALEHHWTSSCAVHGVHLFLDELTRSTKLYLPLNVITVLFYARKKILSNPLDVIRRIVKGTARSALFLSSYVAVAFVLPCWLRHLFQRDSILFKLISGAAAGCCATIDAPGRRLELGMYCLTRALETAWNCGVKWGWWRVIPNGELVYFVFGMGALMSVYQTSPGSIQRGYYGILSRLVGDN